MHDCSVATGDRFLSVLVPPLLRALGPRGLLFLTWDESSSDSGCCRLAPGGLGPGPLHAGDRADGRLVAEARDGRIRADAGRAGVRRSVQTLLPLGGAAPVSGDGFTDGWWGYVSKDLPLPRGPA